MFVKYAHDKKKQKLRSEYGGKNGEKSLIKIAYNDDWREKHALQVERYFFVVTFYSKSKIYGWNRTGNFGGPLWRDKKMYDVSFAREIVRRLQGRIQVRFG